MGGGGGGSRGGKFLPPYKQVRIRSYTDSWLEGGGRGGGSPAQPTPENIRPFGFGQGHFILNMQPTDSSHTKYKPGWLEGGKGGGGTEDNQPRPYKI